MLLAIEIEENYEVMKEIFSEFTNDKDYLLRLQFE